MMLKLKVGFFLCEGEKVGRQEKEAILLFYKPSFEYCLSSQLLGKNSIVMSFKEAGKACLFKNMVLLSYLLKSKHLQDTVKNAGKHCKMMVLFSSIM